MTEQNNTPEFEPLDDEPKRKVSFRFIGFLLYVVISFVVALWLYGQGYFDSLIKEGQTILGKMDQRNDQGNTRFFSEKESTDFLSTLQQGADESTAKLITMVRDENNPFAMMELVSIYSDEEAPNHDYGTALFFARLLKQEHPNHVSTQQIDNLIRIFEQEQNQ